MSDKNKLRIIQCTAQQVRIPLFAPSNKLSRHHSIETPVISSWGKATITGKLTQRHIDVLDILFYCGEFEIKRFPGDIAACLIHPYKLLRILGHKSPGKTNIKWLQGLFEDMRRAQLKIETESGQTRSAVLTGMVREHHYIERRDDLDRQLYAVVFTPQYVRLCEQGYKLQWRADEIRHLVTMPATAKAAARFMRSHAPGTRYGLDVVLDAIGVRRQDISTEAYRKRKKVLKACVHDLNRLGVDIAGDMMIRLDLRGKTTDIPMENNRYPDRRQPISR